MDDLFLKLPLREIWEESSTAPLALLSFCSALSLFLTDPWWILSALRMDCRGESAIYRDAAEKRCPLLILMTLKTHYTGRDVLLFESPETGPTPATRLLPRKGRSDFSRSSEPPETLLAELLHTGLGAGAAGGGRGWHGLGHGGCRHVILPFQSLHNSLEASLLLSEIMLHTGGVKKRGVNRGRRQWVLEGEVTGAQFGGWDGVKSSQIHLYSSFFTKGD